MVRRGGPTTLRRASALVACLPVLLLLTACGADVERRGAAQAADAFSAEVTADPARACRLLAPRTVESLESQGSGGCEQALEDADLPAPGARRAVSVAGHAAQVRYAGETVFLALFDGGWLVTAAGCSRTSADLAEPYDCAVEGS
jgi:hypothetical protein